jgi:glucoamylase
MTSKPVEASEPPVSGTAFGKPGIDPTWCSSDKDFVTTALGPSRLWVTVGHGIVNEVYWPSTGQPQLRDLGFYLVGAQGWIDLKRARRYTLATPGPYLPLLTVTHTGADYSLELEILPDPHRDVLLIRYRLAGPYRLVTIVAPHLGSTGRGNDAWREGSTLYARHGNAALCFASNVPFAQTSCGYVGHSDGWQDLSRHGELRYDFCAADAGAVALTAASAQADGILALGFAETPNGAFTLAHSALADGFDGLRAQFLASWETWGRRLRLPRPTPRLGDAGLLSATILKIHEDRSYPGAVVASLSVPWGNTTDTLGGYHLVWPRDATLSAFALLGAHQVDDVRRMLGHLLATQTAEGRWPQNYFPNGVPFWTGTQLDEAGFPILLAAKLMEQGLPELHGTRRMVRAAVGFIVRTGPSSEQDRWEENPGVSPFTVAVAISALIAAAPWLEDAERAYAQSVADDWNARLEGWCYAEHTALAAQVGVVGHYVRIAPAAKLGGLAESMQLRNRNGETIAAAALVSLDFSYLVRLGLRSAHDPRITDTLKVVDRVLRVATPSGDLYHRYNEDGYGEHSDGRAFDGSGIGRLWPLLVGERAHLAMQAGEPTTAYLDTIWNCASVGGLLPEQVWDVAAIPARGLAPGRPSGSAMPLLWSHAEFLKLLIASEDGRPLEMLASVAARYGGQTVRPTAWHWRDEVPVERLEAGLALEVEARGPFTLHFGFDGWRDVEERDAMPQPFGMWSVRLSAGDFSGRSRLDFTRRFADRWEGRDHAVEIVAGPIAHRLPAP